MKDIQEFPNFTIDINGNVFDKEKNKYLKHSKDNYGYVYVNIRHNNNWHKRKIHRLIALSFIPNPFNKLEVNHIDGNKSNFNINNLEWVTKSENAKHAWENITKETTKRKIISNFKDHSKIVLDTATGIFYNSATEAAKYYNINKNTLKGQLLGYYKNKTTLIYA